MKLWMLSQTANTDYDTFDAAIVAAPDEASAREIHPMGHWGHDRFADGNMRDRPYGAWTTPKNISVQYIGEAGPLVEPGVVLASFNAG